MTAAQETWTEANIALLRRLWGEGWSAGQIASYLPGRVSRSAVIGKVHRLKLGGRATVVARRNPTHRRRPATIGSNLSDPKPDIAARPTAQNLPKGDKVADPAADGIRLLRSQAWTALPGTVPVGLVDLCGCRWPIDGQDGETLFCNAEAPGKGPYCDMHAALAVTGRELGKL